jgi:hypothetical protein
MFSINPSPWIREDTEDMHCCVVSDPLGGLSRDGVFMDRERERALLERKVKEATTASAPCL